MAKFECIVTDKFEVREHPNADKLAIADVYVHDNIIPYQVIVGKETLTDVQHIVFIPENAVVPEWLLRSMNMWNDAKGIGKLSGNRGDRVRLATLRGERSEGIVHVLSSHSDGSPIVSRPDGDFVVSVGDDISSHLGITKYEPPIPLDMAGLMADAVGLTIKYDIDNIHTWSKRFRDAISTNMQFRVTEKIHGTWCCIAILPESDSSSDYYMGRVFTSTKKMSAKGIVFQNTDENANNIYVKAMKSIVDEDFISRIHNYSFTHDKNEPIYIMGELFGSSLQKGFNYGRSKHEFRVFDVYVGYPERGRYLDVYELDFFCVDFSDVLPPVPELYTGALTMNKIRELSNGTTTLGGKHTREGVVIKPVHEVYYGNKRMIAKSISDAYMGIKKRTEYS